VSLSGVPQGLIPKQESVGSENQIRSSEALKDFYLRRSEGERRGDVRGKRKRIKGEKDRNGGRYDSHSPPVKKKPRR